MKLATKPSGVNNSINYSNALRVLVSEVIRNSKPLDKTTEYFFKSIPPVHPREKESLNDLFTFVIRYWIPIHEIYKDQFSNKAIDFYHILHIQQILRQHLNGVPVSKGKFEKQVIGSYENLNSARHIRESYPPWLDNLCATELGDHWNDLAVALNQKPAAILRVNNLKTTLRELESRLTKDGKLVTSIENYPDALRVQKYFDIFRTEEFQQGHFEMQDAGSQLIAPFLEAEAGMRVIDACAGNGGKTLHLASIMNNKGKIIALDIASHKLEVLKKRMKRAGVFNIETRPIDSSKVIKRLYNTADRLLLDVPCSGTGVLKRNPDIKYHLSEERIANIIRTQEEILFKYSPMLKVGGEMVYATCSILPSENHNQVMKFLETEGRDYEFLEEKSQSPLEGYDGFYMARLRRCR